ncbi:hypothetical protein KM043_014778 [Ampulex compressa]|nr:hypothetical protein KM043_014778 [Ampulex compressa]
MVKRLHEEVHLNEHPSSDVLSKLRQTAPTYFTKVKPKHYTLPCRIWEDMDMNHHIKYRTLAFIRGYKVGIPLFLLTIGTEYALGIDYHHHEDHDDHGSHEHH